jgi:hypothetical protein
MILALILLASLSLTTTGCCTYLLLRKSPSSTTPSPTPFSTLPTLSVDPMLEAMKMIQTTTTRSQELLELMIVGPKTETSTSPTSVPSLNEELTSYDYDSTPLSPGIEGVISRELEEDQQDRLMTERRVLQTRLAELQEEENRRLAQTGAADGSPGPWSQTPEQFGTPT